MKTTNKLLITASLLALPILTAHANHRVKRNLYCLSHHHPARTYKFLKEIRGQIHYGAVPEQESLESHETCAQLIKECQDLYGEDYSFIQIGSGYTWGTVQQEDHRVCPHVYEIKTDEDRRE